MFDEMSLLVPRHLEHGYIYGDASLPYSHVRKEPKDMDICFVSS